MYEVKVINSATGRVVHLEIVESHVEVIEIGLDWGLLYELEYHEVDPDLDTFEEAMQQYEDDFGPKS